MVISIFHYLILSFILFTIGLIGLTIRRNLIIIFMCVELMLNSANLALISYARYFNNSDIHTLTLFVIVLAACEVVFGLALIIAIFRKTKSLDLNKLNSLKG